jgi:hypothetical protein
MDLIFLLFAYARVFLSKHLLVGNAFMTRICPVRTFRTNHYTRTQSSTPGFTSGGIAESDEAVLLSKAAVVTALEMASDMLPKIIDGRYGRFQVMPVGITGSHVEGEPRWGIYPKKYSYDFIHDHFEGSKSHMKVGDEVLLVHCNYELFSHPSDVDLVIDYKNLNGSKNPSTGDCLVLCPQIDVVLEDIYNQTGVFISKSEGQLGDGIIPVEDLIDRLKS